jgi:AcrR family transcriptional regulator
MQQKVDVFDWVCYNSAMRTKNTSGEQKPPSFIEAARRAQIIECAIDTLATLGYAHASLAEIAKRADISKSVITYYFSSKEELLKQVVKSVYLEAASYMGPQIAAGTTARERLQAYRHSNIGFIASHRAHIMAIMQIVLNMRAENGTPRFHAGTEEPDLKALEVILRKGQVDGDFRSFAMYPMLLAIRGAIDAVGRFLVAHPEADGEPFAQELVTLFDRATRKEEA